MLIILFFILGLSCKETNQQSLSENESRGNTESTDIEVRAEEVAEAVVSKFPKFERQGWVELEESMGFVIDIKYATDDNFTKEKIYDCGRCYLRESAARALMKLQDELRSAGKYKIKLFDCYRPAPYQQRLWDVVPDARYVMPPHKGSMHSRGLAVDLTLTDADGNELDMGTVFDYFGPEAHTDKTFPNAQVQSNRDLLKSLLLKYGFEGIRTEWWHYSLRGQKADLAEWLWPCE